MEDVGDFALASTTSAEELGWQLLADEGAPVSIPDAVADISPVPSSDEEEDEDDVVAALESDVHELRVAGSPPARPPQSTFAPPPAAFGEEEEEGELVRGQQVIVALPAALPAAHLLLGVSAVRMSTCLFPKGSLLQAGTPQALEAVEAALRDAAGSQLLVLLRSGRFAGAVFRGGRMVEHKTITKYTMRRGQGGSQSAQDNTGKRAKSVGASLRRAGEVALREEVAETLARWQPLIEKCSLVLLVCPKAMRDHLFAPGGAAGALGVVKADPRVRFVPFPTQRPTLQELKTTRWKCLAVELLVRLEPGEGPGEAATDGEEESEMVTEEATDPGEQKEQAAQAPVEPEPPVHIVSAFGTAIRCAILEGNLPELLDLLHNPAHHTVASPAAPAEGEATAALSPQGDAAPPMELNGIERGTSEEGPTVSVDEALLERDEEGRTPLHLASCPVDPSGDAKSDAELPVLDEDTLGEAVYALLGAGANPGTRDWRSRTAYQIAWCRQVRDAFRRYRGEHEDAWDWDACAVPEGLTAEKESAIAERRKTKAKEKRKRQKQRKKDQEQLDKDAQDEAKVAEMERIRREAEEEELRRAGAPKCDACGKPFRDDDVPFFRLDYQYCSSRCVNDHKRTLMAEAAARRFAK